MNDVLEECRQRQEDEIVALESIFAFPEGSDEEAGEGSRPAEPRVKLVQRDPEPVLELYLPITLPRPTRILVDTYAYDTHQTTGVFPPARIEINSFITPPKQLEPVARELTTAPPAAKGKQRNGRNRARKDGHLNAGANVFQPGGSASAKSSEVGRTTSLSYHASTASIEEAVDAVGRISLRSEPLAGPSTGNGLSSNPPAQRSRLRTTKQLPALSHLAPITLKVRLPSTYPSEQPPIVEILTAQWLPTNIHRKHSSLTWLQQKLDEQYHEMAGLEVLYIWATYLSEGLWIQLLEDQPSPEDVPPFLQPPDLLASDTTEAKLRFEEHLETPDDRPRLAAQLLSHSRLCSRTTFDTSSFDCVICLETRKGRACTRLTGCGHVFCSECLAGYLSSLVDDGYHRQAKRCPDPECVTLWREREKQNQVDQEGNLLMSPSSKPKPRSSQPFSRDNNTAQNGDAGADSEPAVVVGLVTRDELHSILGPSRLARLEELTVKAKMEADPSVSYCPRSGCQAAVVRLSTDENSGHWERFRECLSCGFAFCAWCSRSWHGLTSCPVSFQSELIRRYLSLPTSSPERRVMEQKFGRKTLETMVRKYEEEQQTQQWLSDYTTPCPTCGIAIEKSYGCNHMTCKSCQTHYCYLCGKAISAQNPYGHFNTPGYECYHRLFDGLLGDQDPRRQEHGQQGERGGNEARDRGHEDGGPGFALLMDENGIPIHLLEEEEQINFLAWQQFG
ncbi:hypothetical protein NDA18_002984 [Ustilago nuda]|nr:hypothetical protein NDA18_002984 [Ustilago nuda]